MDRLFLDANVLFSAAYRPDAGLLRLWKLKNVVLCSSRYALEEARINLAEEAQQTRLTALLGLIHLFDPGRSHAVFPCRRRMRQSCWPRSQHARLTCSLVTFAISAHILARGLKES
jgi:hypothetical protein